MVLRGSPMFVAFVIVVGALSAAITASAVRKLAGSSEVVATYERVGVSPSDLPKLAGLLIAAAVGLVAGLRWSVLGVVTSACLVVYFSLAVVAHVRAGDRSNVG